jgi:hypothetical protein
MLYVLFVRVSVRETWVFHGKDFCSSDKGKIRKNVDRIRLLLRVNRCFAFKESSSMKDLGVKELACRSTKRIARWQCR